MIDAAQIGDKNGVSKFAVGGKWPLDPLRDGMRVYLDDAEEGPSLLLAVGIDSPSVDELAAIQGPLTFAVMTAAPIAWIMLDASGLIWDAPYAPGIYPLSRALEIKAACRKVTTWAPGLVGHCQVVFVDRGLIFKMKLIGLSREWWDGFASGVLKSPDQISQQKYGAEIQAQQKRWTSKDMIARSIARTTITPKASA